MEDCLQEAGSSCGYAQADVGRCASIVAAYVAAVGQAANPGDIMDEVHKTVTDLNQLNDRCGGGLIETVQREEICEIVNRATRYGGSEDLTEEWRAW